MSAPDRLAKVSAIVTRELERTCPHTHGVCSCRGRRDLAREIAKAGGISDPNTAPEGGSR